MRQISATLAQYLAQRPLRLVFADCFTITLRSGVALRLAAYDQPITDENGNVYSASSIRIDGLKYKCSTGLDVDEQSVTITAFDSDTIPEGPGATLGIPVLQAIRRRFFDGAGFERRRVYLTPSGWYSVVLFVGRVATVTKVGRTAAELSVKSLLSLLDIDYPSSLFQPSCLNTLYDGNCAVVRSSYTRTGTIANGAGGNSLPFAFTDGTAPAAGWFDQGTVKFTSGALAGITVTIKNWDGSAATLMAGLDQAPGIGDGFTAWPGCDHSRGAAGCQRFSNLANWRGYDLVPPPEIGA